MADGTEKQEIVKVGPEEVARTISDDELYGPAEAVEKGEAKINPDHEGQSSEAIFGHEEAAEAAAEEPAGQPEEKPPAKQGEPEEEAEEAEDKQPPAPVSFWDPERQKRDQEHANEKKALQSKYESDVAVLKAQLATVLQRADSAAQQDGATRSQKDAADDLAGEIKALGKFDELDPDEMTAKDFKQALKAHRGVLEKALAGRQSSGDSEVAKEVRELREKLEARERAESERREADRRAAIDADLNNHVKALDEQHGADLHNSAQKLAYKMALDAGYTPERTPDLTTIKLLYNEAYRALAEKKGRTTASRKPARGTAPRSVPGTGGAVPATPTKYGSLDDVLEDMAGRGRFRTKGAAE